MFSSLKNFVSRHKRKFFVTGIAVGGVVLALRYAQRQLIKYQQEQAREFIERTQRLQHFEATERTCNQAIMGVAVSMCQELLRKLDAEPILEQLRKNPDNKRELWDELKILAFTRLTTLVYSCSILVVALRIQINLLGGYMYKDTKTTDAKVKVDIQQSYLSLSQHFIQHGLEALSQLIETKVRQVLTNYDLKQQLSLADIEQIFWSIQMAVNSDAKDPNSTISTYFFPQEINGGDTLSTMYAETLDMFESDETSSLCTNNVSRGFSIVMDSVADYYDVNTAPSTTNRDSSKVAIADEKWTLTNGSSELNNDPEQNINGDKGQSPATTSTSTSSSLTSTSISLLSAAASPTYTTNNGIVAKKADLNVPTTTISNINRIHLPLAKLVPIITGLASKEFGCDIRPPSLSTSLITLYMISDKVKVLGANVYEAFSQ